MTEPQEPPTLNIRMRDFMTNMMDDLSGFTSRYYILYPVFLTPSEAFH